MGTGVLIVLLLAVVVGAYRFQLGRAHRVAAAHLQRALMSERVFAESFHASPAPLALIDLETHQITEVNQAYVGMIGWSREELLGSTADTLRISETNDLVTWARRLRRSGVLRDYETTLRCKDDSVRDVLLSMDLIAIDNRPHGLTTIIDQTEHKRAIQELRSTEDQLRQAQKMESLGMLAGGIAHDFNNLLAVISSCSGLLAESLGRTHPDHELVDDIADAVVRASALTRQLLAFSRKQVTEPVVLDPNVVVTDTRKLVKRMVGVNVEVITSLDPELRPVLIDRGHLVQVILNLAVNSRDAMPGRGTLRLTTRNVGDQVVLEVSDTGTGMSPEVRTRACEPFFTTKEQGKGTGMGLAVVHGIVDAAGGRIEIESEPGAGTTFRIQLPAIDGPVQTVRPVSDQSVRGVETILIVDDDNYVRRATARALRSRGYTVVEAANGRAALVALPTANFDLLLTDIVMPGMSGRVLAEAATARFPELKVLMMTGYTDDEVVHSGVQNGKVDLIEKPFTIAALAEKVRAVLDADPIPAGHDGRPVSTRIALN